VAQVVAAGVVVAARTFTQKVPDGIAVGGDRMQKAAICCASSCVGKNFQTAG